jgi:hypothetical protein
MTTPRGKGTVRYGGDSDSNTQLRSALAQVGSYRCYSCGEPKPFSDLQIDHLIAQSISFEEFGKVKVALDLPEKFDLQGPENLAVICGKCNRSKSNKDFHRKLAFAEQVDKSIAKTDEVVLIVESMRNGHGLSASLASASAADLDDSATRETFSTFAPGLVQRIAMLDEGLVDYVTAASLRVSRGWEGYDVRVLINNHLRFVQSFVRVMLDREFTQIIENVSSDLVDYTIEKTRRHLVLGPDESFAHEFAVDTPVIQHMEVTVDDAEVTWDGELVNFEICGSLDGRVIAHVTGDDPDEPGALRDEQTDVAIYGAFRSKFVLSLEEQDEVSNYDIRHEEKFVLDPDWSTNSIARLFEDF